MAATGLYSDYYKSGCHPPLPDISIKVVEEKLRHHMESQALGTPLVPNRTVSSVMDVIAKCQGGFIVGDGVGAFQKVADEIEDMLRGSNSGVPEPSPGTQSTSTIGMILPQHLLLPPPPPSTTSHSSSPVLRRCNSGTPAVPLGPNSLVELQSSLESKEREIGILKAIILTKELQIDELKMTGLRL